MRGPLGLQVLDFAATSKRQVVCGCFSDVHVTHSHPLHLHILQLNRITEYFRLEELLRIIWYWIFCSKQGTLES